jgi:hypothetical protein
MEKDTNKNPLVFPLLMTSMSFIMYMFAFHSERNENDDLKIQIESYKHQIDSLKITNKINSKLNIDDNNKQ